MLATRERWRELCLRLSPKYNSNTDSSATLVTTNFNYYKLTDAYSGPDRHYHNLDHINDGLEKLDEIKHLAQSPDSLEMAWWWHDVIYDTTSKRNEEESAMTANTALTKLGINVEFRVRVIRLIAATKHDHIPEDPDKRLTIDIDLASLGTPPEIFDHNTANIRKEYKHISDQDFKTGRAKFFQKMLQDRPSIYLTAHFRAKYEAQAQENLKRTMSVLKK